MHGPSYVQVSPRHDHYDGVCHMMWCGQSNYGRIITSHPALEGTVCGTNQWCSLGRCVPWGSGGGGFATPLAPRPPLQPQPVATVPMLTTVVPATTTAEKNRMEKMAKAIYIDRNVIAFLQRFRQLFTKFHFAQHLANVCKKYLWHSFKWLFTPLQDDVPKVLKCYLDTDDGIFASRMEAFKAQQFHVYVRGDVIMHGRGRFRVAVFAWPFSRGRFRVAIFAPKQALTRKRTPRENGHAKTGLTRKRPRENGHAKTATRKRPGPHYAMTKI
ncbi:hypothetical protein niasHT_005737 [Heterodera trifolii]|uniref:ADAMTS cysteine-rich domain-containing protein n=1 Tax=Heterodera trifolii TaxID=157864 RepID=A0ABD2LZ43_9BILA